MSGIDTLPLAAHDPLILMILRMEASSLCIGRGDQEAKGDESESFPSTTILWRSFPGCAGTSKVTLPCLANKPREKIGASSLHGQPSIYLQSNVDSSATNLFVIKLIYGFIRDRRILCDFATGHQ